AWLGAGALARRWAHRRAPQHRPCLGGSVRVSEPRGRASEDRCLGRRRGGSARQWIRRGEGPRHRRGGRLGDGLPHRDGHRSTCEALAEIAAVVTAVTIDSGLAEEASDEASTEEAAPVPEPPKDAAPEPEPPHDAPPPHIDVRTAERERVRSKSTPPEGAITVAGAMEAGALPGVTGGGSGSLALIWPHARWELGASGFAPRMQPVPDTSARARIDLWHVETRACGVPEVGRVAFPLCGGVQAGVMTGRSRGVANRDDRRLPWLAFEASAGI